jgi:hypothetical protein
MEKSLPFNVHDDYQSYLLSVFHRGVNNLFTLIVAGSGYIVTQMKFSGSLIVRYLGSG